MKLSKSKFTTNSTTSQDFFKLFQGNIFVFGNSLYLIVFKLPKFLCFQNVLFLEIVIWETIQLVSISKSALSQQFSTEGRADSDDLGNVFKLQNTQILQDYSGNGLERSKNIAGKKIPRYCGLYFLGRKPVLYFASQEIY